MLIVLALGLVLCIAGVVLVLNVAGAADAVMRRVTTQSLGTLAPGFAASRRGFRVYALLVIAVGVVCAGVGMTSVFIPLAALLLVIGAVTFGVASMVAIVGEVETYRRLKR